MIGRLKGIILEKQPPHLLVDVMGVGYEVQAPMTSFYPLPAVGEEVLLHTHLAISENAHQLFAFYTRDERRLFRTLIKVNGVGPRMALGILSGMSVADFVQCVRGGNTAALIRVPGVGRKTAERLLIEVKDKLQDWQGPEVVSLSDSPLTAAPQATATISADAASALVALGYKSADAVRLIAAAHKTNPAANSQELIRLALQSLAAVGQKAVGQKAVGQK